MLRSSLQILLPLLSLPYGRIILLSVVRKSFQILFPCLPVEALANLSHTLQTEEAALNERTSFFWYDLMVITDQEMNRWEEANVCFLKF